MAGNFTQVGVEAIVKNFNKFNKDLNSMNKAIKESGKSSEQAAKATKQFNSTLQSLAAGGLDMVIGALVAFGKSAVEEGMAFQKAMSNVGAVSGAVGDDFEALEAQAVSLGSTTKFTAVEAAEGMGFLAMAGFETNQIISAMPGTLSLAAAANMDLADSADIVSNIIQGFGATAESTGQFVDVLTKTFTTSNTSLQQLGAAMKFAAPVAHSLGATVEDTAAAIGVLGNAGIQGSLAGTTLRGVLLSLASPTKAAQAIMDELGVAVFDTHGNMLPMPQIIGNINRATAGMTQEQRNATLQTLVGAKRLAGFNVLLAEGEEGLQAYGDELRDSMGTAAEIADRQLDNLAGDFTLFQSALSGFKIQAFELLEPALRKSAQAMTELVIKLQEGAKAWSWIIETSVALNEQTDSLAGTSMAMESLNDATYGVAGVMNPLVSLMGNSSKVNKELLADTIALNNARDTEAERLAGLARQYQMSTGSLEDGNTALEENTLELEANQEALASTASVYQQYGEQAARAYDRTAKAAMEAFKKEQELRQALTLGLSEFVLSFRESKAEQLQSEQEFNASMAAIRNSAAEDTRAADEKLSEELATIEQERQKKIHWVLTGAHARTQAENDAALAHWNAHYDQLVSDTTSKYQEQTAVIEGERSKQLASAKAAREQELAEQKAHLNKLKLNAALATLETTGQLAQFTGGLAVSAQEAANLIEAGILPVTDELALAIQSTLGELQTQEAATAEQATANQATLQQALAGTLIPINEQVTAMGTDMPVSVLATQEAMTAMNTNAQLGLQNTLLATQNEDTALQDITNITLPLLDQTMAIVNTNAQASFQQTNVEIMIVNDTLRVTDSILKDIAASVETVAEEAKEMGKVIVRSFEKSANAIKNKLIPAIKRAIKHMDELRQKSEQAAKAAAAAPGVTPAGHALGAGLKGGIGLRQGTLGLGVTVPPGYPNDTFGPLYLTSREQFMVTPPGMTIDEAVMDRLTSDGPVAMMTVNNFALNVSTVASAQAVIQQYEVAKAMVQ